MAFHKRIQLSLCGLIFLIWTPVFILGFNVDTKDVNVIFGPKGSHFGFAASFLPVEEGSRTLGMIVGAPSGNTSISGLNSGVLCICEDVLNPTEKCSSIRHIDDNYSMKRGTENEEFGASLAMTDSGKYMVCSPNWKETRIDFYTFVPGRCTLADFNDDSTFRFFQPFLAEPLNAHKYIKPVEGRSEYVYGVASFGFSADSDRKSTFVFGSPGVLMSEGTVTIIDVAANRSATAGSPLTNKLSSTAYGYLGYSVKIGRFCDGSDICFAASAPNRNRVGTVHIYRWEDRNNLVIKQIFTERKAWSYFGYALCAVDVNNDGYDELLVGAPHYAMGDGSQEYDQGSVFIYSRTEAVEKLAQKNFLDGAYAKFARFGSAIQNIGDINLDKYNDVAIGAPGENEGAGCIYIYLGGPVGLVNSPSQRITAQQVSTGLSQPIRGFGFAFSDHAVTSSKKYPVFVVTSVVSDAIIVFQTRPIVDVVTTLTADPNPVDVEKICTENGVSGVCFKINLCMNYTLRGGGNLSLTFQIGLDIDIQIRSQLKRALIRLDNGSLVESTPEYRRSLTVSNRDDCLNFLAVLRENQVNQDRFTPVQIVARYTLMENPSLKMNPILDATKPNNVSLFVTFVNKCGDDNKCEVDLSVLGQLTNNPRNIVVNSTKELQVNITVKNSKETSYWTVIKVDVNSPVPYSYIKSDMTVNCQEEKTVSDIANVMVMCNYFKPLDQDKSFSVVIVFDTEQIELTKKTLTIAVEAMPKNPNNPEVFQQDNVVKMTTDVDIIADVSMEGSSSPTEIAIYEAKQISLKDTGSKNSFRPTGNEIKPLNVTHKYLVRNKGPSFLPNTTVVFRVPMFLLDRTKLIDEADVKITTPDKRETQCHGRIKFDYQQQTTSSTSSTQTITAAPTDSDNSNQNKTTGDTATTTIDPFNIGGVVNRRKKRAVDGERTDQNTIYTLDCDLDKDICQEFICVTGTIIPPESYAEISVSLVIDKANIPMPENHNAFYYSVQSEVKQPSHDLFVAWNKQRSITTVTKFHFLQSGGRINIWIIIGSVIAGLVLITVIVLVFWKLGFFKRAKHQQVEQWRRESKRRSRKGYSKAPNEEPEEGSAPKVES